MGIKIRNALISVWNKEGAVALAKGLKRHNVAIYSTGGTAKNLQESGVDVIPLDSLTGFSELIGGRVKTLHPKVFAGILANRDLDNHMSAIAELDIPAFDLIAVNLYPFEDTLAKTSDLTKLVEMIDIGGVALLRAAAKNHNGVVTLSSPEDYLPVIEELDEFSNISVETSRRLAGKAFRTTSFYDALIANTLDDKVFPVNYPIPLKLVSEMRYGENPHQKAALYANSVEKSGIPYAVQLWGKELSYNNILDLDAVLSVVQEFSNEISAGIVKHLGPCGMGTGDSLLEAYIAALEGDQVSAFGGIVGFSRFVDVPTAQKMSEHFFEAVLAPGYESEALEILKQKKNLRILSMPLDLPARKAQFRGVQGGILVQDMDLPYLPPAKWEVVTKRQPNEFEETALKFAWRAVKIVKSNAVIITGERAVFGIGGGLPSRVDAAKLAVEKAGERAIGSVGASDAFFPFPDGMEVLAKAGVTAIVQPGGSIRDDGVTERADELGIAMIHTGTRHFKH